VTMQGTNHDPKMSHGHGPRRGPAGPDSTITCHFVRCSSGGCACGGMHRATGREFVLVFDE